MQINLTSMVIMWGMQIDKDQAVFRQCLDVSSRSVAWNSQVHLIKFCINFPSAKQIFTGTFLLPGMTTTAGTTAAVKMHAMSSPSPSPSSPWAWANSSSRSLLQRLALPQQTHSQLTPAAASFLCPSAWAYALIMTRAGCIFTTPTPWGAFTRGRWIVREQCIRLLASWAAARFSWKSS